MECAQRQFVPNAAYRAIAQIKSYRKDFSKRNAISALMWIFYPSTAIRMGSEVFLVYTYVCRVDNKKGKMWTRFFVVLLYLQYTYVNTHEKTIWTDF